MKAISNVFELADEELDEFEPSAKSFTSRGEVDVVQIDEDEVEDDSEHEWTQTPTSSPPMT